MGIFDFLFRSSTVDVRARFELLREAVSGTMSSFYKARDRQTGQTVGLKILDPVKTKQFEARFVGIEKPVEGEISSKFEHPNIVKTLEYGLTKQGEQFVVMEFLDGPGLNSLIMERSSRLQGNRVELLRQAATALAEVHRAGFIHRDICPRNLVATPDCRSLKLIDFGLAVPATPPFMQPGNRTGTANYMAPEVVRRKTTNHKLDIFSFGVTAFELCTFELPWPKGDGQDAMSHGVKAPADIYQLAPALNRRLGEAIKECLIPDPAARLESMDAFLERIKGLSREDDPTE